MDKSLLRSRPPVGAEDVDRVTLSIGRDDKLALEKIAREKRVSLAWVVRDAVTRYPALPENRTIPEKNQG